MRRNRQSLFTEDPQMNLTPLIDVVFVVLIMFIVIAPMLEIDRVELAVGAKQEQRTPTMATEESNLCIHVHADDTIWFNKRRVSERELLTFLKTARAQQPKQIVQLFHDKKAHFGTYQTVKNAVEISGFEQMDVILQPG